MSCVVLPFPAAVDRSRSAAAVAAMGSAAADIPPLSGAHPEPEAAPERAPAAPLPIALARLLTYEGAKERVEGTRMSLCTMRNTITWRRRGGEYDLFAPPLPLEGSVRGYMALRRAIHDVVGDRVCLVGEYKTRPLDAANWMAPYLGVLAAMTVDGAEAQIVRSDTVSPFDFVGVAGIDPETLASAARTLLRPHAGEMVDFEPVMRAFEALFLPHKMAYHVVQELTNRISHRLAV